MHLKRTHKLHYAEGHKFVYGNTTFNFELGLKSALLACHRTFKSALLACHHANKVPLNWKIYHALFWARGNTIPTRASRVNNMRYAVPRSTVNAHLYSFFRSAIRIWNQLPSSTVSAQSLETFKDQLPSSTMYM